MIIITHGPTSTNSLKVEKKCAITHFNTKFCSIQNNHNREPILISLTYKKGPCALTTLA